MSFDRTPLQILADGIDQSIQYGAPTDMVARLRGAHGYLAATGHVLRDETMAERRKQPTAPVIETIPAAMMAAEVE